MGRSNMWKCASCGAPNPQASDTCYNCRADRLTSPNNGPGPAVASSASNVTMVAPPPSCAQVGQAQAPPQPVATAQQPVAGIMSRKCPYCGADIADDVSKCMHCGEWLHKPTNGLLGSLKALPWKPISVGLVFALVVLGFALHSHHVRQVAREAANAKYRAAKHKADDAADAIKAIGSATSVGVVRLEYGSKVIDAQTKVDLFTSRYGHDSYANYGARLSAALRPYLTANNIWDYKIKNEYGDFIPDTEVVYEECKQAFPEIMKEMDDGGVLVNGQISSDEAMQALWSIGGTRADALRFPAQSAK